jgi:hypothetical protein
VREVVFRAGFGGCHGSDYRRAVGLDFHRFFLHVVLECKHPSLCDDRPLPLEEYLLMVLVPMMLVGAALIFNLYEPPAR